MQCRSAAPVAPKLHFEAWIGGEGGGVGLLGEVVGVMVAEVTTAAEAVVVSEEGVMAAGAEV